MGIITFLSDFGSNSNYVAQMKGVALSLCDAKIVDINHGIAPHNIMEGAYVLKTAVPYFPSGTVHVAVVDPGVGTFRKGIVIATQSQILVGPDNGLLIPTAKALGDFTVYEIANPDLMVKIISNTFHGRDIFASVAAHIINGVMFDKIGPIINDFVQLDFEKSLVKDNVVYGKIIYIDNFGNIVTNIDSAWIKQHVTYGKKIKVYINKKKVELVFVKSYDFVKKDQILATIGSSNYFEISINQGNACKKFNAKPNDEIKIILV
jgi:S-adenosyl-L-methionine hydrolase (adenosine-forming)